MALQKIASPNKVPEIRKGDTVVVMHGKDAGKRGKVDRVIRNTVGQDRGTGYWRQASSRPLSVVISGINVMIVCPHCDRVTRVKHDRLGSGQSARVCGHCREQLEPGA